MRKVRVSRNFDSELGGVIIDINCNNPSENIAVKSSIWLKVIMGALIGFINGFWGGGGGMLCVPILTQCIKLPEKKAHATTLLIMLPLSIVSLLIYVVKGSVSWVQTLEIGVGFVLGGIVGAYILKIINNTWLNVVFSIIIIVGGLKLIL